MRPFRATQPSDVVELTVVDASGQITARAAWREVNGVPIAELSADIRALKLDMNTTAVFLKNTPLSK